MKVLAQVYRDVETVTPQGGRAVFHEPVGAVWLKVGVRRRRERDEAGTLRIREEMKAEARTDPRLEEGLRLRFSGADWRLVGIDPVEGVAGRMSLALERVR